MKKHILTWALLSAGWSATAQMVTAPRMVDPRLSTESYRSDNQAESAILQRGGDQVVWQDNFDDPATWVADNDGQSSPFGWGIRSNAVGWWATSSGINSTSGGNFAELANGHPNPPSGPPTQAIGVTYTLTLADPIDVMDLAGTDEVLLEFEQFGARFNDAQTVQISTDGTTFVTVGDNTEFPMLTNVGGSPYPNPHLKVIDISSYIAGNAETVWIRFRWTSAFPGEMNPNAWVAYGWYIDDVRISRKEEHDLVMGFGYISHLQGAEEYGRVPVGQLQEDVLMGAMVHNFGTETQTNVTLTVSVLDGSQSEVYSDVFTLDELEPKDTVYLEVLVPPASISDVNLYTVNFEVVSDDEDASSPTFSNNSKVRRFEITEGMYSLDGVSVHVPAQQQTSSIGNASFEDADVGFMCMVYFEILETMNVPGFEIRFAPGTQREGAITVSIHDPMDLDVNNVDNPLVESDVYDLTQANVTSRRARVMFSDPVELAPGGYYAAVRMLSFADEQVINIQDDITVPQPFGASVIYIPGDQVYTNGNAFAIRMLGDIYISVEEQESSFAGFNAYPNPVLNNELTIDLTADRAEVLNLSVVAMNGAEVMARPISVVPGQNRHQLNVDGLPSGLYLVRVVGAEKQSTIRVAVQR